MILMIYAFLNVSDDDGGAFSVRRRRWRRKN